MWCIRTFSRSWIELAHNSLSLRYSSGDGTHEIMRGWEKNRLCLQALSFGVNMHFLNSHECETRMQFNILPFYQTYHLSVLHSNVSLVSYILRSHDHTLPPRHALIMRKLRHHNTKSCSRSRSFVNSSNSSSAVELAAIHSIPLNPP